jgi:hypothetical protein
LLVTSFTNLGLSASSRNAASGSSLPISDIPHSSDTETATHQNSEPLPSQSLSDSHLEPDSASGNTRPLTESRKCKAADSSSWFGASRGHKWSNKRADKLIIFSDSEWESTSGNADPPVTGKRKHPAIDPGSESIEESEEFKLEAILDSRKQ